MGLQGLSSDVIAGIPVRIGFGQSRLNVNFHTYKWLLEGQERVELKGRHLILFHADYIKFFG